MREGGGDPAVDPSPRSISYLQPAGALKTDGRHCYFWCLVFVVAVVAVVLVTKATGLLHVLVGKYGLQVVLKSALVFAPLIRNRKKMYISDDKR